jgi:hypothetical protein
MLAVGVVGTCAAPARQLVPGGERPLTPWWNRMSIFERTLWSLSRKAKVKAEARMEKLEFRFNDGGRAAAGFKGKTGDCVARSIAIATGVPYAEVYDALNELAKSERIGKRKKKISSARTGVYRQTSRKYIQSLGWKWVPTMTIGSGCGVHLRADELPRRRLIVKVSKHLTAVVDGVIHDTHDCSRDGERCVYGYWINPDEVTSELFPLAA